MRGPLKGVDGCHAGCTLAQDPVKLRRDSHEGMMQRTLSILLLLLAAAGLSGLGGCASSTTRIEARDGSVALPTLRASFNFGAGTEAPSNPRDGHAVEVEGFHAKGSDGQTLQTGAQPVVLGGQTFAPPAQLEHDFRFNYADVAWRWRKFFGGGAVGMDVTAGIGFTDLDLRTRSTGLQAARTYTTEGPQGGVGLVWRMQPGTSLQARVIEFASGDEGVDRLRRGEVQVVQSFGPYISGRLGWASWDLRGRITSSDSDFRLRFSGPTLGLQLDFGP
jgi:hypothetical protein